MYKIAISFLVLILTSLVHFNVWAQQQWTPKQWGETILIGSTLELRTETTEEIFENPAPLLWEIRKAGQKKPSYLFGTMHSGDEQVMAIGEDVLEWLEKCDVVALELDMDNINFMKMMNFIMMEDTVLTDLVSKEDYQLIKEAVKEKLGMAGAFLQVKRIKPLFLAGILGDGEEQSLNFSGDQPLFLDMWLQQKGKEYEKEIFGIETIDEQLAAIDKIPLAYQAQMLVQGLKEEDTKDKNMTAALLEVYVSRDLNAIYQFYQEQQTTANSFTQSFETAIIVHRNYIMAERMDALMQEKKRIFNAVGALHLPGKEGVINLLRQRGYEVKPVVE